MKAKNFRYSLKYAWAGVRHAFKTEKNLRIHGVATVIALVASYAFQVTVMELALISFSIALVITAELLNTAIENVIDLVCQEFHPLAEVAKNVSAGAVLITALNAIFIAILIFTKYILNLT